VCCAFRIPHSAFLLLSLLLSSRAIHADSPWVDWRQAEPFVCRADFRLTGYEPLLVELQELRDQLAQRLTLPTRGEPIELYLFADRANYRRHLGEKYPEAPVRRAMYIKDNGPGQVFAYRSDEFEIDVRHETTHALLHSVLPVVPLWLDEGLAEYFEVPEAKRAYDNPHLANLQWNIRLGLVPKLTTLESRQELSEMGRKEYLFAWAWTHFMLHGPEEAREELLSYLAELQSGVPRQPLSVRLQRRLPGLEKHFARHFRNWRR
jgi:hypothetical protein